MIPVAQQDVTENTSESFFTGFNLESLRGYVSVITDRMQTYLPSTADIEMSTVVTTDASTEQANTGFSSFNLQAIQAYISTISSRIQALPGNLSQGCETASEFCNQNKDMLVKGAAALFLVGVIITCSIGPATCSTFHVINHTGETLEISYLSPYSASFTDANSKSHKNHPIWKPKGFWDNGMVSVDKGYSTEVVMHVKDADNFFADPFTVNLNSNGKDFSVHGEPNKHLTAPEMGFFICTTELKNGPPPAPVNSTGSVAHYLRG
jgi:hypothetical protein